MTDAYWKLLPDLTVVRGNRLCKIYSHTHSKRSLACDKTAKFPRHIGLVKDLGSSVLGLLYQKLLNQRVFTKWYIFIIWIKWFYNFFIFVVCWSFPLGGRLRFFLPASFCFPKVTAFVSAWFEFLRSDFLIYEENIVNLKAVATVWLQILNDLCLQ